MTQQEEMTTLIEHWTRSQQQIWETWMESLRKSATGEAQSPTLHQGMESWQAAVNHTLDTQAQAVQAWVSQMGDIEGASPQAKRWAEEGAKMLEQWTAAQRGLWQQWFQVMGTAVEGGSASPGGDQLEQLMAGWRQVGKQMQVLQSAWARSLTPGNRK